MTYSVLIAHGFAGDMDIELIETALGAERLLRHLAEHRGVSNYIKAFWENEEHIYEVVEAFKDAGFPIVLSRRYFGELFHFDTSDELYGLFFETSIRRNEGKRTPVFVYP